MGESEPTVELAGESSELDALAWWGSHSEFSLYNVEKTDDRYCLKSPRFVQIRDSKAIREEDKNLAIWKEAKKLLPIIKANAKIRGLGGQSIKIGSGVHKERGKLRTTILTVFSERKD